MKYVSVCVDESEHWFNIAAWDDRSGAETMLRALPAGTIAGIVELCEVNR